MNLGCTDCKIIHILEYSYFLNFLVAPIRNKALKNRRIFYPYLCPSVHPSILLEDSVAGWLSTLANWL